MCWGCWAVRDWWAAGEARVRKKRAVGGVRRKELLVLVLVLELERQWVRRRGAAMVFSSLLDLGIFGFGRDECAVESKLRCRNILVALIMSAPRPAPEHCIIKSLFYTMYKY